MQLDTQDLVRSVTVSRAKLAAKITIIFYIFRTFGNIYLETVSIPANPQSHISAGGLAAIAFLTWIYSQIIKNTSTPDPVLFENV